MFLNVHEYTLEITLHEKKEVHNKNTHKESGQGPGTMPGELVKDKLQPKSTMWCCGQKDTWYWKGY